MLCGRCSATTAKVSEWGTWCTEAWQQGRDEGGGWAALDRARSSHTPLAAHDTAKGRRPAARAGAALQLAAATRTWRR